MICCCDTSTKTDAITLNPVADESVPAFTFQENKENSAPPVPQSPARRELTREETADEKEKLQKLIRTFVKDAVAGLNVTRVDADVERPATLALDKKLKLMHAKSDDAQVDLPLISVQISLLKHSPKAAERKSDDSVVSIVSTDPALDWLVKFESAKMASDFVTSLKVLHEAAKKAA